jgi:hypothetical protein
MFRLRTKFGRSLRKPRDLFRIGYLRIKDVFAKRSILCERGLAAKARGDYTRAASEYSRAVGLFISLTERTKNAAACLVGRARVFHAMGLNESAVTDCRAALESDPDSAEVQGEFFKASF